MTGLLQDLRSAIRQLQRSPGFAAVAILSLAREIGANTAIFSLINSLFLKSLPVRSPQQLVAFGNGSDSGRIDGIGPGALDIALGVRSSEILWMVIRDSVVLLGIGIAVGVPATVAVARSVRSQLFGLTPYDATMITSAVAAISAVVLVAAYIPARRAARVDPMAALRYE
jgi:hypothetical protein